MTLTNRRRVRLALAAALPFLLAPLTAGVADAATWTHRDARGDVTRVETDLTNGEQTFSEAPADARTDVTRVTLRHLARRIVLTAKVRDFRTDDATSVLGRLVTPRGDYLLMTGRGPGMFVQMLMTVRGKDEVHCSGMSSSFDAARDVVRIELPRTCLGAPSWVRAGLILSDDSVSRFSPVPSGGDDPEILTSTFDDGLRAGGRAQTPKLSPKVRVG